MKIKFSFFAVLFLVSVSIGFAQPKVTDPKVTVTKLYKDQKAGTGPFFQTKNRAAVDKYFVKDLADLIWKDAVESKGEVGKLGFDPLYGVQDPDVKNFVIQDTAWGGDSKFGVDGEASVQVAFKIGGEDHWVWYLFHQQKSTKQWKIYDVKYIIDGAEAFLKGFLSADHSFVDKKLGISFSHPDDFDVVTSDGADAASFDVTITPKNIPEKFRDSYHFQISMMAAPAAGCDSTYEKGLDTKPPKWPKTRMFGDSKLQLFATAEGGMGGHTDNFYGYRGVVNKSCFVIQTSLRTGSAQMYDEKTYALDQKLIEALFLRLLDSFLFIK